MKKKIATAGTLAVLGLAAVACSISALDRQTTPATSSKSLEEISLAQSEVDLAKQTNPGHQELEEGKVPVPADLATIRTKGISAIKDAAFASSRHGPVVSHLIDPRGSIIQPRLEENRDRYEETDVNSVKLVSKEPVSTFSIDVDTASYANVRRFLEDGVLPPVDAVRVEELLNYFNYAYPTPESADQPFAADIALFDSPWDQGSQLLRIGLKGYSIETADRPAANLVFLVDTSGSMESPGKLPLLKRSFRMLVDQMEEDDSIAIVAYAGSAGVVLEPTYGKDKAKILAAIDSFKAGGSTAGAEGIRQAYQLAEAGFDDEAINRVILATDGDFNVGVADPGQLEDFIARKRKTGVYLSILGFGRGNLNDILMQKLAQAGNGNASYIDSLTEARKVLVDEMGSTLFPIANDVKIQIEFSPKQVAEYRLIGYETRMLAREDFNNDKVDAGEIGSGHTVTALYEITTPDSPSKLVDDLRYGIKKASVQQTGEGELAWLRMRYKRPGESESILMEQAVMTESRTRFEQAPDEAKFAAAVAGFGQILRQDPNTENLGYDQIYAIAREARGEDVSGYRSEFLQLVKLAETAEAIRPVN